jgi:hypothetical protein
VGDVHIQQEMLAERFFRKQPVAFDHFFQGREHHAERLFLASCAKSGDDTG